MSFMIFTASVWKILDQPSYTSKAVTTMDQTERKAIQMLVCHKMRQDMDPNSECAANYFHKYISYSMMQHHELCKIYRIDQHGFNQSHFEWNGFTDAFCVQN